MNAGTTAFLLRVYQDFKWSFEHLPVVLEARPSERAILRKMLATRTPVIFDVGANLGASIAYYHSLFPQARFFGFEPDPATFARLNKRHGRKKRVTLFNAGVGSKRQKLTLHRNVISAVNSFHELDQDAEWTKQVTSLKSLPAAEVDVVSLDEIATEHNVTRIDFLKSDTQGFEPEVLLGANRLLREKRIGLLKLEVLPAQFYRQRVHLKDLEAILAPLGYELVTIGGVHYGRDSRLSYFDAFFAPASGQPIKVPGQASSAQGPRQTE